jgi:hypothetical protein
MFFDSSQVNNFLNCKKCEGRLDEPKLLPCGNSICSHCVSLIQLTNYREFECLVCQDKHEMPKNGLPISKALVDILSIKSLDVSRGNAFETLQGTLKEIENNKIGLKHHLNNSDDCIKEYCIELRGKVQLTTEQAIEEINGLSEQVIGEINDYEQEIINLNKNNVDSLKRFETIEQELETFQLKTNEYLKLNNLNDEKMIKLNQEAVILKKKAESEIKSIRNIIFSGRSLIFEANDVAIDSDVLGELIMNDVNDILDTKNFEELMKLCEFSVDQKWDLIYKASKDGFEAEKFHSKCDNKPNTLVVARSKNGNIFGGYTEQSWSNTDPISEDVYKADSNAFIFSLINRENRQLKVKCSPNNGICCDNTCGPIFGGREGDSDLKIAYSLRWSYSYFGNYYIHPDYEYKTEKAKSFLAGSNFFQVLDFEVYTS